MTPYIVAATSLGIPRFYIESVARLSGPSLTGRIAAANPGTHLFNQHRRWAVKRWKYTGNVFDVYAPAPRAVDPPDPLKVVVTFGTEPYPFDRAISNITRVLPPASSVTWQLGPAHDPTELPEAYQMLPERELAGLMERADVVVAHAGAGSALAALRSGKKPILIPRLARYGEVIDDHQQLLADDLVSRGLAVVTSAEDLSSEHLHSVAGRQVVDVTAEPIRLD